MYLIRSSLARPQFVLRLNPVFQTAALACLASACFATAQVPDQVERAQQYNQQQQDNRIQSASQLEPDLYDGESADTGSQFILQRKPARKWFQATVDSQYYYTSNMLLAKDNAVDTAILVNTVQVAVAPTAFDVAGGKLSPQVGFRYQWYNYGLDSTANQLNDFDFDMETVFASARYQFEGNWYASAGFDWNRLLTHGPAASDYAELYKEYVPNWTLGRYFPLSQTAQFSVEYFGAYHFTETNPSFLYSNDRLDEGIRFLYTQELVRHFYIQPSVRVQYSDYVNSPGGSDDLYFSAGVSLTYALTDWASIRTFFSYDLKDSNNALRPDYESFNSGGGVTLSVNF